jgi:hypothetical protein
MIVTALAGFAGWLVTGDWLIAVCLVLLLAGWLVLKAQEGPPVLALAYTMQWTSICIGLFYVAATGRPLQATLDSDYRPMVAIGAGVLAATLAGLYLGQRLVRLPAEDGDVRPQHALSFKTLMICYIVGVAGVGVVQQIAWDYPSVTQAIIALTYIRLGLLYLVLRRLVSAGQWPMIVGLMIFEIGLGITGFYAGFREPLIMAALAMLERFDRRSVRQWFSVTALALVMCTLGVMWVSVRTSYRERFLSDTNFEQNRAERLDSIRAASNAWMSSSHADLANDVDTFIDRMWTVYYPALAVARVPNVVPYANGALMNATLQHVLMPRVFFPDKAEIGSDSELVRKYAGVKVAGADENTDIAFGYAAESYVDFGVPLMFLPVFIWALFMGAVYGSILRWYHYRDIAVSVSTVICWLSLYLFERSWSKTIGLTLTLLIYVGGLTFLLDRLWYERFGAATTREDDEPVAAGAFLSADVE